jgi:hypothetical protein
MATTFDDIDDPTPEKFTEYISLWMNESVTAPNWTFLLKAQVRRVIHDGTTVKFLMKNGAVYSVVVTQTTPPIDLNVMTREEYEANEET